MTLIRPLGQRAVGSGSLLSPRVISEYPRKSASDPAVDRPPLVTLSYELTTTGG